MPPCGLERLPASRSTEPRVFGERRATKKLRGRKPLLAFELDFEEFKPCLTGAGGKEAMIVDVDLSGC